METTTADGLFDLAEIHPSLSGRRITLLRTQVSAGLSRLHANLAGCRWAVFDHVTEFGLDGVFTSIGSVTGFRTREDAAALAESLLDGCVAEHLVDERWQRWNTPARAVNVLPATGSIVPGIFPRQVGFAALRASEYETCYIRLYLIKAEPDAMVDALLANTGFGEQWADLLADMGCK